MIKPISEYEFDLVQSYIQEINSLNKQIKDLKIINNRLCTKLKQCKNCEEELTNKWYFVQIREIAEKIYKQDKCNPVFEAKEIMDKCDNVLNNVKINEVLK